MQIEMVSSSIVFSLILGLIFAWLAARKNRRSYIWGPIVSITGFLFIYLGILIPSEPTEKLSLFLLLLSYGSLLLLLIAMVAVMVLPYLCPKCKGKLTRQQWKEGQCLKCSEISEAEVEKVNENKIGTRSWFLIIVPPLFLSLLVLVPLDIGTVVFWGPAFIILLVSAWHLFKFIVNRIRKKMPFQRALFRPLFSVMIIIGALVLVHASQGTADNFGRRIAHAVDIKCKKDGRCPESVDGFECDPERRCRTLYGDYGAKFKVSYTVSKDRMNFVVVVHHNIDEALILEGGVTDEIREK